MLSANNKAGKSQCMRTSTLVASKLVVLGILALSLSPVFATSRPVIPEPGEDLKLTQGIPVDQFFAARTQNTQCQAELKAANEQYHADKKALNVLLEQKGDANTIDRAEQTADASRKILLAKTQTCGLCATQDLEKKTVTTNKKEYWYLTDGSCYIGQGKDSATLNRYFENAVNRLKNMKKYPGKSGGFRALLEFNEIDMDTGELLPPVDKVDHTPFYAFIGVRGPVALGMPIGFWYIFKNDLVDREQGDLKEFFIRFESVKKPANFPSPDLKIQTASGKQSSTIQRELTVVQGMWYLNNRGYYRYYTGADFGINIPFGTDFANNTLMDTLLTLSEDSTTEN